MKAYDTVQLTRAVFDGHLNIVAGAVGVVTGVSPNGHFITLNIVDHYKAVTVTRASVAPVAPAAVETEAVYTIKGIK